MLFAKGEGYIVFISMYPSPVAKHSDNGYSKSGYPVLFTDSPPSPLSERRQTRISDEQWFPGLLL